MDLTAASAAFRASLPAGVVAAVADLVRTMNCYYSNLIEGHATHPVDIERALQSDYSAEPERRNLQLEALAHVSVQQWIDAGGVRGREVTAAAVRDVHTRFTQLLPDELRWVDDMDGKERVEVRPGELRRRDVRVGRHVAVSPGAVPRFLSRFEETYGALGRSERVLAAAAAHHRLLWIHPFLDGNGRVARLVTHAVLLDVLDTGALWSVARGLARNEPAYKGHLAACDASRRNDLDGRGDLSEEALAAFTRFFLEVCLDQVAFMRGLMRPDRLRVRMLRWAEDEIAADRLPPQADRVLEQVLVLGELPRGDVGRRLGVTDRHARRVTAAMLERKVLASAGPREPLRLAFPATLAGAWMPGLFPEA
jgi:Fic family protein